MAVLPGRASTPVSPAPSASRSPSAPDLSPPSSSSPRTKNTLRTPGRISVCRSADEGASWTECTAALLAVETSVLREAMATDNRPSSGVYFGTRDGALFASPDGGDTWQTPADELPGVRSVKVADAG